LASFSGKKSNSCRFILINQAFNLLHFFTFTPSKIKAKQDFSNLFKGKLKYFWTKPFYYEISVKFAST